MIASSAYDENERGPAVIAIWKLPTGYGCPERIQCAPHHAQVRALLDEVCRDAFDAGRYQHVATAVNDGELVADDLRYLFNAYGAFHGYEFKKLRYLNDFFYDADAAAWLPQPCLAKIRSLANERALSAAQASMQVQLRQLWKQASAD
ncbi:MAG: hypothetical protein IPL61_39125 [Myxococcales bacterium]|nr:hypothetical protein [Myxococcales bacterium]